MVDFDSAPLRIVFCSRLSSTILNTSTCGASSVIRPLKTAGRLVTVLINATRFAAKNPPLPSDSLRDSPVLTERTRPPRLHRRIQLRQAFDAKFLRLAKRKNLALQPIDPAR